MKNKETTDSKLIADYRSREAARRASSPLNGENAFGAPGQKSEGGVVTATIAADAKPVSALGGPTKVFGPSQIWIPEFRRSQ